MKITSPQPDLSVTSGSAPCAPERLPSLPKRLKTIDSAPSTPATACFTEPHDPIAGHLALCTPLSAPTPERQQAANIVIHALRQQIAEKAYRRFFSLNPRYAGHYEPGQSATAHLQTQSRKHLAAVTQRLGVLTPKEQAFFDKVAASPWAFQHTSDHDLELNGHLRLYSSSRLNEEGKLFNCNTPKSDRDLVFLSIDFAAERIRGAASEEKVIQYNYGNNVYVIQEDQALLKQGFMTLTDSIRTAVGVLRRWQDYPERYRACVAEAKTERKREMGFGDENPCYVFSDMKSALALHVLEFLRQSKDAGFVKFVLEDADLSGTDLNHILGTLFDCEFHLPRSVVTSHYAKFQQQEPRIKSQDAQISAALNQQDIPLLKSFDKQQLEEHITLYFSYPPARANPDSLGDPEFLATLIAQELVDYRAPALLKALIETENLLLLEVMFKHGADETSLNPEERADLAQLRRAGASLQTIIMTADSQALERYIGDDFDRMSKAFAQIIKTNATALIDPLVTKWQLNAENLMQMKSNSQFYNAIDQLAEPEQAPTLDKLLSSGVVDPETLPSVQQGALTPLQQAIQCINDKTAKVLIQHGADISKLSKDEHKQYAFLQEHGNFLENLIERTDLTTLRKCLTDKEMAMQVLGQALARNNSEVVGMVLSACTEQGWHISAQDYSPADAALLDMKACVAFLNSGYAKPAWFGRLIPAELLEEARNAGLRPLTTRFH